MKLPCEMMEDLLPLYAEEIVTPTTRTAVEEHLANCEACRGKLSAMRRETTEKRETMALETVRRELRWRRLYAVMAAVCTTVALLLTMISWEARFLPLPYSPDAVVIEALEDGRTSVTIRGAEGINMYSDEYDANGRTHELFLEPYRQWRTMRGATATVSVDADVTVWYVDQTQDGEMTRLLGERPERGDGGQVLPRLSLGYYLLIAGVVAVLALAGWLLLRRKRAGWMMKHLALLALCYVAAHGLVIGAAVSTFSLERDFGLILLLTPFLWGLAVSGMQLIARMRRDRT